MNNYKISKRTSKYKEVRGEKEQVINGFTAYLETRGYAKDTVRADTNYTASFLAWIAGEQTHENEVSYNDLLTFIDYCSGEGDSNGLINRKISAIRKYYEYLQHSGSQVKNPAAGLYIKTRRQTVPANLLSAEDLAAIYENYQVTDLRSQRNKVIIGLLVYQGITREEVEKLEVTHVKLTSGKIEIPGGRHSNGRILPLEAAQMLEMQEYIQVTRPQVLQSQGRYGIGRKPDNIDREQTLNQLFTSMHASGGIKNTFLHLVYHLRRNHPKLIDARQIRQSVITLWLKTKDLRTAQYMAGHRYVSSTERYQINNLEDLQHQLEKLHPLDNP
jgi:integrase/recombinase XerD